MSKTWCGQFTVKLTWGLLKCKKTNVDHWIRAKCVIYRVDCISSKYYWVGIRKDVEDFVKQCDRCQRVNPLKTIAAVLHPVKVFERIIFGTTHGIIPQVPQEPFTKWGVDLIGPFTPSDSGNKYVCVMTEYTTRWPEALAIPSKEAKNVLPLLRDVICRFRVSNGGTYIKNGKI